MIILTVKIEFDTNDMQEAEELLDTIVANGIDAAVLENEYKGKDIKWEVVESNESTAN